MAGKTIIGLSLTTLGVCIYGCAPPVQELSSERPLPAASVSSNGTRQPAAAGAGLPAGVVRTTLKELAPMQAVVGYDQIYARLGKFERDPKEGFDDYCESIGADDATGVTATSRLDDPASFACTAGPGTEPDDMKTAVRGPGGKLFLTDGHHTLSTFWDWKRGGPAPPVYVRVVGDYSQLKADEFWKTMASKGRVWLQDGNGKSITPAQLPTSLGLGSMKNDFYRGLVYFTREIGYDKPDGDNEFLEFYWGQWLRHQPSLSKAGGKPPATATEYAALVRTASTLMVQQPATTVISAGKTASQLGQMVEVDTEELAKLTRGGNKPGKLTDLFSYRAGKAPPR